MVCPIRAGGGCVRVGGTVWNTLKGWDRKEGRENKDFKKGGELGQGVGTLKMVGWNPLMNYGLRFLHVKKTCLGLSLTKNIGYTVPLF